MSAAKMTVMQPCVVSTMVNSTYEAAYKQGESLLRLSDMATLTGHTHALLTNCDFYEFYDTELQNICNHFEEWSCLDRCKGDQPAKSIILIENSK